MDQGTVVALDIGNSAVRLCIMSNKGNQSELKRFGLMRLDLIRLDNMEYSFGNAASKEEELDIIRKTIAGMLKKHGINNDSHFKDVPVIVSIPSYHAYCCQRFFDKQLNSEQVSEIIAFDVMQEFPFKMEELYCEYQESMVTLPAISVPGLETPVQELWAYLEVVAKRFYVERIFSLLPDDVKILAFVPSVFATYNWLERMKHLGNGDQCVCLINLGTLTDVIIKNYGIFAYWIQFKTDNLVAELKQTAEIDSNCDTSAVMPGLLEDLRLPLGEVDANNKTDLAMRNWADKMIGRIWNVCEDYRKLPNGGQVERFVVVGSGCWPGNFCEYLNKALNKPVDKAKVSWAYAEDKDVALLGLAITGLGLGQIKIAFHPEQKQEQGE